MHDADDATTLLDALGLDIIAVLGWSDSATQRPSTQHANSQRIEQLVIWSGTVSSFPQRTAPPAPR